MIGKYKIALFPRTCPKCQKTILILQKYYPLYIKFRSDYPWDIVYAEKWNVCESCYNEYIKYRNIKYDGNEDE